MARIVGHLPVGSVGTELRRGGPRRARAGQQDAARHHRPACGRAEGERQQRQDFGVPRDDGGHVPPRGLKETAGGACGLGPGADQPDREGDSGDARCTSRRPCLPRPHRRRAAPLPSRRSCHRSPARLHRVADDISLVGVVARMPEAPVVKLSRQARRGGKAVPGYWVAASHPAAAVANTTRKNTSRVARSVRPAARARPRSRSCSAAETARVQSSASAKNT